MKALRIKPIKNSELLTARLITERLKGNYDVHTKHPNQTNTILSKLEKDDIYTLKIEELEEIGEFINKIQKLLSLIDNNDVITFTRILETVPSFRKKYNREAILELISKKKYNTKEVYNLKIKAYAHVLELNINTCHFVVNKFKSEEITSFDKTRLTNLIESIWSGLSPEELKIMFGLSKAEVELLVSNLYSDKEKLFASLGDKYTNWHNTYVNESESISKILNERLAGNMSLVTPTPNFDYEKSSNLAFDLNNLESAKIAAELSVKILFYLKLYPSMPITNLKAQLEELVKKDHVWSKEQLSEIKKLGKTKAAYVKDLKAVLADETGLSLANMKSQTIASICDINEKTYSFIDKVFIGLEDVDSNLSFVDISNIILLMRTDIKSECIQYIYKLDSNTIELFSKLFKNRLADASRKEAEA